MPYDTVETRAFNDARQCRVIRGPSGKFCEIELDEDGNPVIVREFDPVVMAEVNQSTGAIVALTRLEFSDAYHRQGITEVHNCHDGCGDVNVTDELTKAPFADMELHQILDNYKYDASSHTLVAKMAELPDRH